MFYVWNEFNIFHRFIWKISILDFIFNDWLVPRLVDFNYSTSNQPSSSLVFNFVASLSLFIASFVQCRNVVDSYGICKERCNVGVFYSLSGRLFISLIGHKLIKGYPAPTPLNNAFHPRLGYDISRVRVVWSMSCVVHRIWFLAMVILSVCLLK